MRITNEQINFLKKNVKDRTVKDLTDMFNAYFKTNMSEGSIKHYKRVLGLKSGLKMQFKKGYIPHNKKSIGSEFISDGYTFIKVEEPNTWVLKHRHIWESVNGKVPEGYCVIFADGNRSNFNIDNLILVEIKDKLVMKNLHLFSNNKELTTTGILTAKLINKCSEIKNR